MNGWICKRGGKALSLFLILALVMTYLLSMPLKAFGAEEIVCTVNGHSTLTGLTREQIEAAAENQTLHMSKIYPPEGEDVTADFAKISDLLGDACAFQITGEGDYQVTIPAAAAYFWFNGDDLRSAGTGAYDGGNYWTKGISSVKVIAEHAYENGVCTVCGATESSCEVIGHDTIQELKREQIEAVAENKTLVMAKTAPAPAEEVTADFAKISDLLGDACAFQVTGAGDFAVKIPAAAAYLWFDGNDLRSAGEAPYNSGKYWVKGVSSVEVIAEHSYADGVCTVCGATEPGTSGNVWDGKTIDVSWYNPTDREFHICNAQQLMGLAAIVNGIVPDTVTAIIGDESYIKGSWVTTDASTSGTKSGYRGIDDFDGKVVYLESSLDMGGVYDAKTDSWSGTHFVPIGGAFRLDPEDPDTQVHSVWGGTFDGKGHTVSNIYTGNLSNTDWAESVGFIGRIGCHDSEDVADRPTNPGVRNLTVTGYFEADRSVGGIVGKIGKVNGTAVIQNCANYATVIAHEHKGAGGIAGAAWNNAVIRNCYNAGSVTGGWPCGGIAGSNEVFVENCYNIGTIDNDTQGSALGSIESQKASFKNCYWLEGSAASGILNSTANDNASAKTSAEMKDAAFVTLLNNGGNYWKADTEMINNGYPVLTYDLTCTNHIYQDHVCIVCGAEGPTANFTDMENHWAKEAVDFVVKEGLFNGTSETTFEPEVAMTRGMLVTVLWRLENCPAATNSSTFRDVAAGSYYETAIAWANEQGIVKGYSADTFLPNREISREELATVLYRYADQKEYDLVAGADLSGYADYAKISDYAKDAMSWANAAGLITGRTATAIHPDGEATRAEVATIFQRFSENVE